MTRLRNTASAFWGAVAAVLFLVLTAGLTPNARSAGSSAGMCSSMALMTSSSLRIVSLLVFTPYRLNAS